MGEAVAGAGGHPEVDIATASVSGRSASRAIGATAARLTPPSGRPRL